MSELLPQINFYLFAVLILGSAVLTVTRRNAITAAMFLALCLLAVGGLFVSLGAEFLFAVQVLVYTGGVMVLFLFVIMLVNVEELERVRSYVRRRWMPLALIAASFAVLALVAAGGTISRPLMRGAVRPESLGSNTREVSLLLFTDYLIPFEIVSILLLVAMIGAIVLAKKEL